MKNKKVIFVTQAAMISAIYIILSVVFAAFGTKAIQLRLSEAMTILPIFTSAAIPGLFVGCLVSNMLSGCILPDIIFGSLATLIGAVGTYFLRKMHPLICTLPPMISNTLIIPFVLYYSYGEVLPIPYMMFTVGIGEILSCGVLGMILYNILKPFRGSIFKY